MQSTSFVMRAAGAFITSVVVFAAMVVIAHGLRLPTEVTPFLPVVDRGDAPTSTDDPTYAGNDGRRTVGNAAEPRERTAGASGGDDTADDANDASIPVVRARPVPIVTATPLPDDAQVAGSQRSPDRPQRTVTAPATAAGSTGTTTDTERRAPVAPEPTAQPDDPQKPGPGSPAAEPSPSPTAASDPDPTPTPAADPTPTPTPTPDPTPSSAPSPSAQATADTASASEQATSPP